MARPRKISRATADLALEYDFTRGVRGKYARRFAEGSNVIVLEPDVAEVFHSPGQVNDALRTLAAVIRRQPRLASR